MGGNYEATVDLARKLHLSIEIDENDWDLVALSSSLWFRTDAMKKLFAYPWKYNDFPEEPMPNDGTISHAIERIFGFVSVDAGWNIGTIMTTEYAANTIEQLQEKMIVTYDWLSERRVICNTVQLEDYGQAINLIEKAFSHTSNVYLYGAGVYGRRYLERMHLWGYEPRGFLVSNGRKSDFCNDYLVYELNDVDPHSDYEILISVNYDKQDEIVRYLKDNGYYNYSVLPAS